MDLLCLFTHFLLYKEFHLSHLTESLLTTCLIYPHFSNNNMATCVVVIFLLGLNSISTCEIQLF